jgi:hypothetical protein
METYFASSNYKGLPIFMPSKVQIGSTRQDDKFNIKESKSTKDIFYSFILSPDKLSHGVWIDNNTNNTL